LLRLRALQPAVLWQSEIWNGSV